MEKIQDRLKHLRKEILKKSQTEFGKKIGLSAQAIAEIEKGRNTLTDRNIEAISREYDVNPQWLRTGEGEIIIETNDALIKEVTKKFDLKPSETILLKTFLELKPEQRESVMQFITDFARNLAAQMGFEFNYQEPKSESQDENDLPKRLCKPKKELSMEEKLEMAQYELEAEEAAKKRGTSTLSASIGLSGASSKNLIDSS